MAIIQLKIFICDWNEQMAKYDLKSSWHVFYEDWLIYIGSSFKKFRGIREIGEAHLQIITLIVSVHFFLWWFLPPTLCWLFQKKSKFLKLLQSNHFVLIFQFETWMCKISPLGIKGLYKSHIQK